MDREGSQGKRLIEAMAKIQRVASKHKFDDILPQREFYVLEIINCRINGNHSGELGQDAPPGIKVSELSEILHITKPSVSQMINGLEQKGFVKRVTSKSDRRVVYIALDENGEAELQKAKKAFLSFTDEIVNRLGHDETEHLIALCNRLYEIIGDIRKRES
ncbi:MarR family winged helix-turn-helix transcriptional regulator [Paenibacillus faecalis]|uniref:MarR family winged helix-turn-helix transcriptional regulator n=1 Tax=Paenibacillus faecalis TaxID=2079532 RepID=UPI00131A51AC|nr:MarR family transcriptional regulator [Paenibacillus faecalis]